MSNRRNIQDRSLLVNSTMHNVPSHLLIEANHNVDNRRTDDDCDDDAVAVVVVVVVAAVDDDVDDDFYYC
jgi:hypothetical protein